MTNSVAIVMGSKSDKALAEATKEVLDGYEISSVIKVLSAHRTPEALKEFIETTIIDGTKVFVGIAGLAAHLSGNIAAHTTLPVIGIPGDGGPLNGLDALFSTVQMPRGVPVATVAIGKAGAVNAGHLAAQMLATGDQDLAKKIADQREEQKRILLEDQ
jgi:5-(carboxyamino)imidazole ribonucleotide mutase